jgi:hypothetical protein
MQINEIVVRQMSEYPIPRGGQYQYYILGNGSLQFLHPKEERYRSVKGLMSKML